jgi:phasin family protein
MQRRGKAQGRGVTRNIKEIRMNPPQADFLELYKAGLKNAVDLLKATLESAERLQQQQISAIRGALEQQVSNVEALGNARSVEELVSLQQKMAGAQFERVMDYWGELCQAAGKDQSAALDRVQQQMARARDWFNDTYVIAARATEEATTIAAATAGPKRAGAADPSPARETPVPPPRRGSQGAAMHR